MVRNLSISALLTPDSARSRRAATLPPAGMSAICLVLPQAELRVQLSCECEVTCEAWGAMFWIWVVNMFFLMITEIYKTSHEEVLNTYTTVFAIVKI